MSYTNRSEWSDFRSRAEQRQITAGRERHIHRATLTAMDVDKATLTTLEKGPNIDGISNQVKDLLYFSEKLTRTPAEITIADIDTLKNKGISEQTIEDTINVVSLLNYLNRLVDAFGVKGNPDYFKMVGTSLARNGYAALIP